MRLHLDVVGETQYSRAFDTYAHEADDLSDPLAKIGEEIRLSVSEQFRTEGAHGLFGRWQALDPAYERWKRGAVGDQPILVFHGTLRSAMLDRSAIRVEPRRVVYEPNAPGYAIVHQKGEDPMPERPMIALPMTVRRQFDRIFAEYLNAIRRGPIRGF